VYNVCDLRYHLKIEIPHHNEKTKRMNYLIVTPVRNEEKMLPNLAKDIVEQVIKPILWVIVDDASEDRTWLIIKDLERKHPWIVGIKSKYPQRSEYANERYAYIVEKGFKYAVEYCRKHGFDYDFLGVVDADVRLENEYFKKIIEAFKSDPRLGIACGFVLEEGMSLNDLKKSNIEPRGCALVLRRECYEEIGGFRGHSNSLIKARNRNWHVKVVSSARVFHQRKTGSGRNYLLSAGKTAYYLNYHPINAFLTGIYYIIKGSPIRGLSYFNGYFGSFILRKKKIEDEEIKEHYWNSFKRLVGRIARALVCAKVRATS